ncbi:MAG: hypothetical protein ABI968_13130 [Acidobacteriota bacterium]
MRHRILFAAVLLGAACALRGDDTYQIELYPAGSIISTDAPAPKGNTYLFHRYPAGTFVSLRMTEVRQIHRISARAVAETNPAKKIIEIHTRSLPGSTQAGPTNLSEFRRARKTTSK